MKTKALVVSMVLIIASKAVAATDKQTEFNDDNYQPLGAVNVIPAVTVKKRRKAAHSRKVKTKPRTVKWTWEEAGFSNNGKSSGVFHYQLNQHSINTSKLCDNYKAGSLIYRDCRKAAKRYFNQQCSSKFPQACSAAGMTP